MLKQQKISLKKLNGKKKKSISCIMMPAVSRERVCDCGQSDMWQVAYDTWHMTFFVPKSPPKKPKALKAQKKAKKRQKKGKKCENKEGKKMPSKNPKKVLKKAHKVR